MADALIKHPPHALNALSEQVFEVLANYTAFPWPIMMSQCKRCRVDPVALTPATLKEAIPHLSSSVARFTSPQKGEQVRIDLEALAGE